MESRRRNRTPRPGAFTLVELLVVIFIIALVSAVTLPTVLPALSHREVSEAARILQASLVGIRDAAIRANEPRGLRLLPDPTLTVPSLATASTTNPAGSTLLAYNRFVAIEPAPDYSEGMVTFNIPPSLTALTGFPTPYFNNSSQQYPCYYDTTLNPPNGSVLLIEQAPFLNNVAGTANTTSPTSWFWNIRVGDRIRFSGSGGYYTIVGPMTINPLNPSYVGQNPELFVNAGPPGTQSLLMRPYTDINGNTANYPVEFLYLVNGHDDNGDGYTDEGFDGVDNNGNGIVDDFNPPTSSEWEMEQWLGPQATLVQAQITSYLASLVTNSNAVPTPSQPVTYSIKRRPVVTQGAREVNLPTGVVIDATTWNASAWNGFPERSRLPIDPSTLYLDVMLNPTGEVVPTTVYSNPASFHMSQSFYHFWLAERQDVQEPKALWGSFTNPNSSTNAGINFVLPMTQEAYSSVGLLSGLGPLSSPPTLALKGDRRLITLFARNGLLTTHTIENFDVGSTNYPFLESEFGAAETR
jgi:type II secretory pathway pseudopilin PulG